MKKKNKMNKEEVENLDTEKELIEDIESQPVEEETEIDKFEEMSRKLEEMNDKFLRLYSEFENYRKRTAKEKMEMIKFASEDAIKDLLPVVDDYERALEIGRASCRERV